MPYASLCDLMRFMMCFDAGRVALAPRQSPRNAPRIGMPWTWQSSSIDAVDSEQHKAFGANVSNVSNIYVLMTLDDLLMFFQDPRAPKEHIIGIICSLELQGGTFNISILGTTPPFLEVSTQKAEFLKGQHSSFKGFVWYYWLCCIVLLYSALHIIDIAYIIAKGLRSPVQDSLASRETAKSSGAVAIGKCIYVYVRCSFCACFFSFWRRVVCHFRKLLTMRGELHSFYQLVMYGDANHFFCPANSLQRFLQPLICKLHDLGRWNRKSYIWRLSHTKGTRFAHCWLILLHLIVCSFIQLQRCHALPITNDSQPKCVYECLCIEVHGCQWMFTVM